MTVARQQRKTPAAARHLRLGAVFGLILAAPWGFTASTAAFTERIVADRHTGLALNGFDPVAYFAEGTPTFGQPEIEASAGGVTWRFRNSGNRAAFIHRPDVYMPRYGGYDPIAAGRGVAVPGNPLLWLIRDGRLYLFYDRTALNRFAADPEAAILAAERSWPKILKTLQQ
jgi:hypothetical protein